MSPRQSKNARSKKNIEIVRKLSNLTKKAAKAYNQEEKEALVNNFLGELFTRVDDSNEQLSAKMEYLADMIKTVANTKAEDLIVAAASNNSAEIKLEESATFNYYYNLILDLPYRNLRPGCSPQEAYYAIFKSYKTLLNFNSGNILMKFTEDITDDIISLLTVPLYRQVLPAYSELVSLSIHNLVELAESKDPFVDYDFDIFYNFFNKESLLDNCLLTIRSVNEYSNAERRINFNLTKIKRFLNFELDTHLWDHKNLLSKDQYVNLYDNLISSRYKNEIENSRSKVVTVVTNPIAASYKRIIDLDRLLHNNSVVERDNALIVVPQALPYYKVRTFLALVYSLQSQGIPISMYVTSNDIKINPDSQYSFDINHITATEKKLDFLMNDRLAISAREMINKVNKFSSIFQFSFDIVSSTNYTIDNYIELNEDDDDLIK